MIISQYEASLHDAIQNAEKETFRLMEEITKYLQINVKGGNNMNKLREVYIKIGTEVENKIPKEFIEFDAFWKTNKSDNGYTVIHLNKENQIVQ